MVLASRGREHFGGGTRRSQVIYLETQGFEEAAELLANVDIAGQLSGGIDSVVYSMTRFAAFITPVATGAMRDAWTGRVQGLAGVVYINPAATNPRSGVPVTQYAGAMSDRLGIQDAVIAEGGRLAARVLEEIQWRPRS